MTYSETARLVMEMVGELHQMGYGRLKLHCYVKEGLGAWRVTIFSNGRWEKNSNIHDYPCAFEWDSWKAETPEQAALSFVQDRSNAKLLEDARGQDPVYVRWYAEMLAKSAPDGILEMETPDMPLIYTNRGECIIAPLIYKSITPGGKASSREAVNARSLACLLETGKIRINHGAWLAIPATPKLSDFVFNRIEGMLLGIAIGDSLGAPTESQLPLARQQKYGELRDYIPNPHSTEARGFPTDDTQLSFWMLEQLVQDGGFIPQNVAFKFANSGKIYGIGGTVKGFLAKFKSAMPWYECGLDSAGNGALMRIAPILLPHLRTGGTGLWVDAALAGMLTHNSFASNSACLAFVAMLWELLDMKKAPERDWWVDKYVELAQDLEGDAVYVPRGGSFKEFSGPLWRFAQEKIRWAQSKDLSVLDACNSWYSGAYLLETLPSVLYILSRYANEPEEAMVRAVNDTKDNDTVAAIVGAALGALYGTGAFPKRWMDNLSGRTGPDDDGRIFELIGETKRTFWRE